VSERSAGAQPRGPELSLFELTMGATMTQAIAVACRLNLPDALADGPKSVDELGAAVGESPDAVVRILRVLESIGVVRTDAAGYSLTAFGQPLRSDAVPSLRAWALMAGSSWFWGPLGHVGQSLHDGRSGFDIEYGTEIFEFLTSASGTGAQSEYDRAMGGVMAPEALEISEVFDFGQARHVVDVGGGNGSLCLQILASNPHLTGAVLDRPAVAASAREDVVHPAKSRCTWEPGSFFESVPSGADVYLLSRILHDWHDEPSATILGCIRRAMSGSARLLVVEQLVGETPHPFTPLCDLNMAALYGTRERTRDEMASLLASAGLETVVISPLRSGRFLIECRLTSAEGGS
jgi:hypothetical protein